MANVMKRPVLRRGALVLLAAVTAVVTAPMGAAQDLTAEQLEDGLKGALKERLYDRVPGIIDLMIQGYPNFSEDEQKDVAKAISGVLKRRVPEGEEAVYVAAAASFAHLGPHGLKNVKAALKVKSVKDNPDVLSAALASLGAHKDVKEIKTIVDYLVYKEPSVVAAAATSLGANYRKVEEKRRKEIVGELVKAYANYHSLAAANAREPIYRERLAVVERPMKEALRQMTGLDQADAPAWQKWYNDNKSKKWEDLEDGGSGR